MHLFVLRGMVADVSLQRLYRDILPFCAMEMLKLALLVLFPIISLWLPSTMAK
jgi:TRAP-type C4-dicarboxylate transport system permease large subunit